MFNLKGRVAVITGASSGLGKQMARAFAHQGADLAIMARRVERLEAFKKAADGKATKLIIPSDIAGVAGLATAVTEAVKTVTRESGKNDSAADSGLLREVENAADRLAVAVEIVRVVRELPAQLEVIGREDDGRGDERQFALPQLVPGGSPEGELLRRQGGRAAQNQQNR